MSRAAAARAAGMDRQTLRDRVHRFNAEGEAGLGEQPRPGRRPRLSEGEQAALKAVVLRGPAPGAQPHASHGKHPAQIQGWRAQRPG